MFTEIELYEFTNTKSIVNSNKERDKINFNFNMMFKGQIHYIAMANLLQFIKKIKNPINLNALCESSVKIVCFSSEFLNIYCELHQICHFSVSSLSYKH